MHSGHATAGAFENFQCEPGLSHGSLQQNSPLRRRRCCTFIDSSSVQGKQMLRGISPMTCRQDTIFRRLCWAVDSQRCSGWHQSAEKSQNPRHHGLSELHVSEARHKAAVLMVGMKERFLSLGVQTPSSESFANAGSPITCSVVVLKCFRCFGSCLTSPYMQPSGPKLDLSNKPLLVAMLPDAHWAPGDAFRAPDASCNHFQSDDPPGLVRFCW